MNRHTIEDYLDLETLTPERELMGEYSDTEWWSATIDHFDELLWMYYPDRIILLNRRFPYNPSDPENADNIEKTIKNIKRTFAIYLKANNYKYSRLYNTIMMEYNPLYNVDATEVTDRNLDHTGKYTDTHSGDDSLEKSGSEKNIRSGSESMEKMGSEASTRSGSESFEKTGSEAMTRSGTDKMTYSGEEDNTKSGSEELSHTGSDSVIVSKTTFDDDDFYGTEKTETIPGATDTTTFNQVKDAKTFVNREDTRSYTDLKDEQTFEDREDVKTYNDVADTLSFEDREDVKTYNNVTDEMSFNKRKDITTYNSEMERENDLHDVEHVENRRFGNIGVTSSQSLIEQERNVSRYEFFKEVVHDCVNLVSYAIEC